MLAKFQGRLTPLLHVTCSHSNQHMIEHQSCLLGGWATVSACCCASPCCARCATACSTPSLRGHGGLLGDLRAIQHHQHTSLRVMWAKPVRAVHRGILKGHLRKVAGRQLLMKEVRDGPVDP